MQTSKGQFASLAHFILETLVAVGDTGIEIFFPPNYPGTAFARSFLSRYWRHRAPSRKSLSGMLTKLRAQGLVARGGGRRYGEWRITPEGRRSLPAYRALAEKRGFPDFSKSSRDGTVRIVTFDVPERERRKRDWLRECLKMLEFRQLQKSVWLGFSPLPEEFLLEVEKRNLSRYVHIVSIQGHGTLPMG